ncbi:PIR Superfamily Protein [Plasmodium ovale wallikeri]|uniref:PIR Superfamily Protein n=1 Tax=Plasmodium ovale wallikeri TaxID=864142 RepID=A0A1A9AQ12_PLAOA|nr:PIR Superfamily Protein [Plasmodium ovale wallikeri]SBT58322.1 PIR Superfamily Protein [Plasmodium ovale wallikeri]
MAGDSYEGISHLLGKTETELFTEKFYQNREFDILELHNYGQHCKKELFPKQKTHMKILCEKVLKYLEKSPIWKKNDSVYDECWLLNYWIYDKLDNYFYHNKEDMDLAFGTLQLIWFPLIENSNNRSFYKKCKPLFKEILDHHDWKQRKELYDYYVDYSTLYGTARSYLPKCEEYYKIIEAKKSLYEHFDNQCLSNDSNCPEIYEKCRDYNPEKVLSDLPCHDQIEAKKAPAAEASARALSLQQSQGHGYGVQLGPHPPGTVFTEQNSDIGKKVGHSVLGVAPVLLTATALYRYTPIGSWIRKLGGTNTNSINDMDGFSAYTQESGDMFSDNTGNYISYQPI